jgi:hypothetical protein
MEGEHMAVDRSATIQSVAAIEASIRARADTDKKFINWWIYLLLLSWITLGIAGIYFYIKRISRVDKYSVRKQGYYAGLVDFTDRYGQATDQQAKAGPLVADIRNVLDRANDQDLRPIGALKSVLLTLVTFGIYGFVVWYQLNRAWADRQRVEVGFNQTLNAAWLALGITRYPITFEPAPGKERNFWLYLGLMIITLGIWGLVWDYKFHTDPDSIYPRIHGVEDTVVQLVRSL